ncbi:MAG TPA: glycosyltransferase family 2 protein [Nitrospiraceae bacterium]|jgi:GT2 family glycosyltransferase|nr:glycosyltransferase family 2 protein [Nitrospiraceae bacterium]
MADTISEISVAVVSFNTRELTLRGLASAQRAVGGLRASLTLVDNGSSDGTVGAVERDFPQWRIMSLPDNPGYGAALNRAFADAPAKYYLALNSDVLIDAPAVRALCTYLDDHPSCGLAAPALLYPDGRAQPTAKRIQSLPFAVGEVLEFHALASRNRWVRRFYYLDRDLSKAQDVEAVSGAVLLIKGEAYRRIGGFDEGFRLYFEETDLCIRLRRAGYDIAFVPDAQAVHVHGASTSQTTMRRVEYYVSYVRLLRKHRGGVSARVLAAVVMVRTFIQMVGLVVKYPPISSVRASMLVARLAACGRLLRALWTPPSIRQGAVLR